MKSKFLFFNLALYFLLFANNLYAQNLTPRPTGVDEKIFTKAIKSIYELLNDSLAIDLESYTQFDYGYHVCPESVNPKFGYKNIEPYHRYYLKNQYNEEEKIWVQYSRSGVETQQVTIDVDIVSNNLLFEQDIRINTSNWLNSCYLNGSYRISNQKLLVFFQEKIEHNSELNNYNIKINIRRTSSLNYFRKSLPLFNAIR